MKVTKNLGLSLPEATDPADISVIAENFRKLDGLGGGFDLLDRLKNNGVVQVATGSYMGTGTYGADHPHSLTFNFVPKIVILGEDVQSVINSGGGAILIWFGQENIVLGAAYGGTQKLMCSVSNTQFSYYTTSSAVVNQNNKVYRYAAVGLLSAQG